MCERPSQAAAESQLHQIPRRTTLYLHSSTGGFASYLIRSPDTSWNPRGRINGPLVIRAIESSCLVYQTNYLVSVPSPVHQQCLRCFFFSFAPTAFLSPGAPPSPQAAGLSDIYIYLCFFLPTVLNWSSLSCSFLFSLPILLITTDLSCFPLVCFSVSQSFRQCPHTVYMIATISTAPLYVFSQFLLFSRVASLNTLRLAEVLVWSITILVPFITDNHVLLVHGSSLLHSS